MNDSQDNPVSPQPPLPENGSAPAAAEPATPAIAHAAPLAEPLSGEPSLAPQPDTAVPLPAAPLLYEKFPEDLRAPWSWPDLILFIIFVFGSSLVLPLMAIAVAILFFGVKPQDIDQSTTTKAAVLTAGQALWSVATIMYLYVTVRLRRNAPFWRTIGWKPLSTERLSRGGATLVCLLGGVATAVVVEVFSAAAKSKGPLPIEELFRSRSSVLLLMSLGILVAPLVEETIFRGYIYPVLARGVGVPGGIVITGVLFGGMHAPQLWGGWGQIALITLVGILFTYIRARTGTVLASYLFHLGYNGFLFLGFFVATGGLRHIPGNS
jgi:membrane protease YdiL (CAAX protease family)